MNREIILSQQHIENKIYNVRGVQVMLDSDLAAKYEVSTGRLNEQVKRNIERFPDDFLFQLTQEEWDILMLQEAKSSLRSQNAILENKQGKHRKYLPYVFIEKGVSGLSGILKSQAAANMHVAIMRTFELKTFTQSHDRFLIIDGEEVYHLGASLKDLGKKCLPAGQAGFAFSKMDKTLVNSILKEVDL